MYNHIRFTDLVGPNQTQFVVPCPLLSAHEVGLRVSVELVALKYFSANTRK